MNNLGVSPGRKKNEGVMQTKEKGEVFRIMPLYSLEAGLPSLMKWGGEEKQNTRGDRTSKERKFWGESHKHCNP